MKVLPFKLPNANLLSPPGGASWSGGKVQPGSSGSLTGFGRALTAIKAVGRSESESAENPKLYDEQNDLWVKC